MLLYSWYFLVCTYSLSHTIKSPEEVSSVSKIFSTYDYKPDRRMTTSKIGVLGFWCFKIYISFVQKKGTRLWSAFDIFPNIGGQSLLPQSVTTVGGQN